MVTARCCAAHITSPPHSTCKPGLRAEYRHLLPFPPAAAENNRGETGNTKTQPRVCSRRRKADPDAFVLPACTHTFCCTSNQRPLQISTPSGAPKWGQHQKNSPLLCQSRSLQHHVTRKLSTETKEEGRGPTGSQNISPELNTVERIDLAVPKRSGF